MYSRVGSPGSSRTTWASQILWNKVRGVIGPDEVYNGDDEAARCTALARARGHRLARCRVPGRRAADARGPADAAAAAAHGGAHGSKCDARTAPGHRHRPRHAGSRGADQPDDV